MFRSRWLVLYSSVNIHLFDLRLFEYFYIFFEIPWQSEKRKTRKFTNKFVNWLYSKSVFFHFYKDSFIRRCYNRSKWSDTLELFGCICLIIILFIGGNELCIYGRRRVDKIPGHVSFNSIGKNMIEIFQFRLFSIDINGWHTG